MAAYPSLRFWLLPFIRSRIWTVRGIEHLPKDGAFILAPNHQAWIDSAILAAAIYRHLRKPLRFVSMSGKYGVFGTLPIDLQNKHAVIDTAMREMSKGFPIVIFPEGNSNKNLELRTGKTGAARLALRSGLPVIPVGIRGTRGVKPWRSALWFFSFWRPCHVVIGEPMSFQKTELSEHDDTLLQITTATIMEQISALSGKAMPGMGPSLTPRGKFWFFVWRVFRPFVQWRIRIKGAEYLPAQGPFIVAGNHPSYFDAPVVAMATFHVTGLQPMFLTKSGVVAGLKKVFGKSGADAMGMLGLNDADKSQVLQPAIEHLQHGGVIGIFPEGGRNLPKRNPHWKTEFLKGKTGTARLVIATGVPVIPAAVNVPHGIGMWESIGKACLPWLFMRVTFGPPVQFANIPASIESTTKDNLEQMTRSIMQSIGSLNGMKYPY